MYITDRLLIYGLEFKDISKPVKIGNLVIYPAYDIKRLLRGYDQDKVQAIIDAGAKYAEVKVRSMTYEPHLFDYPVTALRLFKPGWIKVETVRPVMKSGGMVMWQELDFPAIGQNWADPMFYELSKGEIPKIDDLNQKLEALPRGYLDVALRRFNRSYDYWMYPHLDDCFVDLVIALESIASGGGDSIMQSMILRIPLLLGDKLGEGKELGRKIKRFYKHRSNILHGGETSDKEFEERFAILEELRALVRETIKSSIELLSMCISPSGKLPKGMAEVIDEYVYYKLHRKSNPLSI